MGRNRLMVITDDLSKLGQYLAETSEELESLLGTLDGSMSSITGSWKDNQGSLYKAKFSSFVEDSRRINREISELSTVASKMARDYQQIVDDHVKEVVI